MQFIHHDLGYRQAGEIVEITISAAANVRLMDSSNFASYKSGRQHSYHGGLATKSPVRLSIPNSGTWYVTVDMQGLRGSVRSAARILPGPLPALREAPLSSVPSLVQRDPPPGVVPVESPSRDYDVFISHASEDKDSVVRPLAHALRDEGLAVWYDEFELRLGDSLRRKIDAGLAKSRFGVVVLSRAFFGKGWTNYELDGLVTRTVSGEQILLPIWHEITKQELIDYSPSLADKVARSTGAHTIKEIATEIVDVIRASELIARPQRKSMPSLRVCLRNGLAHPDPQAMRTLRSSPAALQGISTTKPWFQWFSEQINEFRRGVTRRFTGQTV